MRLHEGPEIRVLAAAHGANLGEVTRLERLADEHGDDAVLGGCEGLPPRGLTCPSSPTCSQPA